MKPMTTTRPEASEYAEFYGGYVNGVPEGDILELLQTENDKTIELLSGLTSDQAGHRYAPDKWSIREMVGHMIDGERTFGFRALCFARQDPARLPGFEQDDYVKTSNAEQRELSELTAELRLARQSNLALFRSFDDEMWSRRGIASECEFTVRGLVYITAGHEIHHRRVLTERYLEA